MLKRSVTVRPSTSWRSRTVEMVFSSAPKAQANRHFTKTISIIIVSAACPKRLQNSWNRLWPAWQCRVPPLQQLNRQPPCADSVGAQVLKPYRLVLRPPCNHDSGAVFLLSGGASVLEDFSCCEKVLEMFPCASRYWHSGGRWRSACHNTSAEDCQRGNHWATEY